MEIKYVQEKPRCRQPVPECMCTQVPAEGQRGAGPYVCIRTRTHECLCIHTVRRVWMFPSFLLTPESSVCTVLVSRSILIAVWFCSQKVFLIYLKNFCVLRFSTIEL